MGLLALLLACGEDAATTAGKSFREYAGEAGRLYELRPPAPPDTGASDTGASDTGASDTAGTGPSRWLRVSEEGWTLTEGATADVGTAVGTWALRLDGGLFVDDTCLLPDPVLAGTSTDSATVRAVAAWETRYGAFPDAADVDIVGGAWAGTQVFAHGVGPVFLTLDGAPWETVWYE